MQANSCLIQKASYKKLENSVICRCQNYQLVMFEIEIQAILNIGILYAYDSKGLNTLHRI